MLNVHKVRTIGQVTEIIHSDIGGVAQWRTRGGPGEWGDPGPVQENSPKFNHQVAPNLVVPFKCSVVLPQPQLSMNSVYDVIRSLAIPYSR